MHQGLYSRAARGFCGVLLWSFAGAWVGVRAQEGQPEAGPAVEPAARPGMVRVKAGDHSVDSVAAWKPDARLTPRPPELWQWYMHGVMDVFGAPSCWEDLLSAEQQSEASLDTQVLLQGNPFRASTMPSLRVEAGQVLVTGKPLIPADRMGGLMGKTVRVFVWMAGQDTGQGRYLWDAVPRADALLTDSTGRVVSVWPGLMATRGTFPWHCFYRDVPIPDPRRISASVVPADVGDGHQRARGLYLRLSNPATGTVWFSTPSWEQVGPAATFAVADLQDPVTGSMAPNPRFDELPVHLASPSVRCRGISPAFAWTFLSGAAGGAAAVPNVVTKAGLGQYLDTVARQDPHHLVHGVARLPEWLHAGAVFKCLPEGDADLMGFLSGRMLAAQDAETGFWGYEKAPRSLAVTAAVVERMFGGSAFRRADRPAAPQPWLVCGEAALPRPDAIVRCVLALQGNAGRDQTAKGGWPAAALTCADPAITALDTACSLAATADAVFLLRRCSEGQPAPLQARCERAVREAVEHVWRACLLPSGLWKQSSRDLVPTTGGAMARLVEMSPLLEFRQSTQLSPPAVPESVTVTDGAVRVAWAGREKDAVSLRLYLLPEGVPVEQLGDQYLAGVVSRSAGDVRAMDPLLAVLAMRAQARLQWGEAGFEDWPYTAAKLAALPSPLPTAAEGQPLALMLPIGKRVRLYACTANLYGETSRPVEIPIKGQAEPAPAAVTPAE